MKMAWIVVIVLGMIIIILLGVLFFYNPAKAPTTGMGATSTEQSQ